MARVTPLPPPPRNDIELEGRRLLRLGDLVGRGTSAAVYRGVIESGAKVKRLVAMKIFDVVATDERDIVVPRIGRAVRHAAFVQHPNVVESYDFGSLEGGQPYILSQLVEGRSLAALMEGFGDRHQRMPLDLALFIGTEIAEGLIGARVAVATDGRQLGVTHGDLSARDVLLSWNGEVKISDFGISRAVGAASTVRRIAMLAKRATTLAPEVAQGEKGDARADVFSLGVILHEMLMGPRFPAGMKDSEMLERARAGQVHTPMFAPQLPSDVHAIVARAVAVDPALRFPHAGALAYELRRAGMAMGVGDGRVFLRNSMQNILDETLNEASSDERPIVQVPPSTGSPSVRWRKTGGGE
jgi:serine/threonine protein kinase